MRYKFTKMQSLGNDFVMLDGITEHITISKNIARQIADRHFGIGCDQIILVQKNNGDSDFTMRIFNSDGSEVGQCGNGARCLAVFLRSQGLWQHSSVIVDTITVRLKLDINTDSSVTVNMGVPKFSPKEIPMQADLDRPVYSLYIDQAKLEYSAVSMGNPHCVISVPDVAVADVSRLGPCLESHPVFPERANVGFREIVSRSEIRLRVFERGVGETLGCGSGACASVVTGIRNGLLDREVLVNLPGGSATVSWAAKEESVRLTGPAEIVFQGEFPPG